LAEPSASASVNHGRASPFRSTTPGQARAGARLSRIGRASSGTPATQANPGVGCPTCCAVKSKKSRFVAISPGTWRRRRHVRARPLCPRLAQPLAGKRGRGRSLGARSGARPSWGPPGWCCPVSRAVPAGCNLPRVSPLGAWAHQQDHRRESNGAGARAMVLIMP
jgi:hypothetical protein